MKVVSSEAPAVFEVHPPQIVRRQGAGAAPGVVVVCEHAVNTIPPEFGDLGLDAAVLQSHVAWDPGALAVAEDMRRLLDADLVAGSVSRLLYDCNRPPEAPSAVPIVSEIFEIPGNRNLTEQQRNERVNAIYQPFRAALSDMLDARGDGLLITVHSFTPVFHGVRRPHEIGVLHDTDTRLADALLDAAPSDFPFKLELNVPYSASDGVTHTLREHAIPRGWPNVMLEIRNDLIDTAPRQIAMARRLVAVLAAAVPDLKVLSHV